MAAAGRGLWWLAALAPLAVLPACSPWSCDFDSHGACIEFVAKPANMDDARRRVDALLGRELAYWNLANLDGWRVQFRESAEYTCYFAARNEGCTDYVERTLSVRIPPDSMGCFEAAELLHELGHYELGDPMHSNPVWRNVDAQFAPMVWDHEGAPPECIKRYGGITSGIWTVESDSF
jgi:hypothetical protein